MIAGLEELVLQCPDENTRSHIREAVKCYESGSYRAAIITTYVAVCFDLIEKLRSLSAGGDAEAKALLQTLSNLQNQQNNNDPAALSGLLEFERNLLEDFRDKFDFFGVHEFEDLSRLRQDRNRCAHPTFQHSSSPYSPSAELARLHVYNALTLVLSQQPRQGKAALESLKAVVLAGSFPTSATEALERLRGSELAGGRPSLIRAFVDELAFGWPDPASPYFKKIAAVHGLLAVVELDRAVAVPRLIAATEKLLRRSETDAVHLGGVLAVRIPDVGEAASGPARAVLKRWLENPATTSRGNALKQALKITWLRPTASSLIADLTSAEVAKVSGEIPEEVVTRASVLLSSVKNWTEANKVAEEGAVPLTDRFSAADVERVLDAAITGAADLQGSGGFKRFLRAVADRNPMGKDELNTRLVARGLGAYLVDATSDESDATGS